MLGVAGGLIAANMTPRGQQRPVEGSATSAGPQVLPGGEVVTLLAAPVAVDRTGSAVVEIGPAPVGADHLQVKLSCLSAGTFTFADGASVTCSTADVSSVTGVTTYELVLHPGQHSTTITTEPQSRWRLSVTYARVSTSGWGVNASGQTFGVANGNGTPTLVAVIATNGRSGYSYAQELAGRGRPARARRWPGRRTAQQEVNVPVYTSDGKTVIGTFVTPAGARRPLTQAESVTPALVWWRHLRT